MKRYFRHRPAFRIIAWKGLAFLLACNYFAFRTELFSEEFERDQPAADFAPGHPVFSLPDLNWETFDKDNAPKAFVCIPPILVEVADYLAPPTVINIPSLQCTELVHDKSPPFFSGSPVFF